MLGLSITFKFFISFYGNWWKKYLEIDEIIWGHADSYWLTKLWLSRNEFKSNELQLIKARNAPRKLCLKSLKNIWYAYLLNNS